MKQQYHLFFKIVSHKIVSHTKIVSQLLLLIQLCFQMKSRTYFLHSLLVKQLTPLFMGVLHRFTYLFFFTYAHLLQHVCYFYFEHMRIFYSMYDLFLFSYFYYSKCLNPLNILSHFYQNFLVMLSMDHIIAHINYQL